MKPIIGITVVPQRNPGDAKTQGELSLHWNYPQAVADAGGVPVLIPPMADMSEISRLLDGWLIPGGDDLDAAHFGEANHPEVELQDPARYASESNLYKNSALDMPILGICYGCQFLNVVRGGSLIQHLPDKLGNATHSSGMELPVELVGESKLSAIAPKASKGHSSHHQAVGRVGANLKVVAQAPDGAIEAVEATDRPWLLAVQWHPERSPEDPANRAILREFVAAARAYAEAKAR